jgi:hypothetical protein
MAGIRNKHAAPPRQKEAVLPEDLIAMLETLDRGTLRGLRDRAMLLSALPAACAVRKSPASTSAATRPRMARLDRNPRQGHAGDAARQDRLARGRDRPRLVRRHLPVVALETWLKFARIAHGPLFRRVTGQGKTVAPDRLNDQEVARLVKRPRSPPACVAIFQRASVAKCSPGIRCAPASPPRPRSTSAMSRSSSAMPQAEMTRKYQRRRDRFRVNLTKASGLFDHGQDLLRPVGVDKIDRPLVVEKRMA